MTRPFRFVLLAVSLLCAGAFFANEAKPADTLRAAVLLSLAVGLLGTYAVVSGLMPVARAVEIRDSRILSAVDEELEPVYSAILAAFPERNRVCWHYPLACDPACDCKAGR